MNNVEGDSIHAFIILGWLLVSLLTYEFGRTRAGCRLYDWLKRIR